MGEDEGWAEPSGLLPNGLLPNAGPLIRFLDPERWLKAEERTAELIACIQPNPPSEGRRKAVADYVQRLIMKCFPCKVVALVRNIYFVMWWFLIALFQETPKQQIQIFGFYFLSSLGNANN